MSECKLKDKMNDYGNMTNHNVWDATKLGDYL